MVPKMMFLTKGVGQDKNRLSSFELALRDAGIERFNLVHVSSILPPQCKIVPRKDGLVHLKPGQIVYCVLARNETDEPNRLISASIGVARAKDENQYGYLSEHHAFGQTAESAGDFAEDLAATMLASTLGIAFDPNLAWDERKEVYQASGTFFKTSHICQSAEGNKNGLWTTVIAAAVFIMDTVAP
ncbi:MAG: arginine decarboxylase, pyruvoyl-dependent [candidate division Zixibacteria bacterium]|nr:arginine decarboxylase, pyruvoyl-dependent [candidate division Zixibacteria bacterium]